MWQPVRSSSWAACLILEQHSSFNGPHEIHGVGTFRFLRKHLRWPPEKEGLPLVFSKLPIGYNENYRQSRWFQEAPGKEPW